MTRVYHHAAEHRFAIYADYNPALVAFFRSLPASRWNGRDKSWTCDATPAAAKRLREYAHDPCLDELASMWGESPASTPAPRLKNDVTPWPHQDACRRNIVPRHAALLDMGMGTGKSLATILALNEWHARTVLILCPVSVMAVWRREIDRYEPRPHAAVILDSGSVKKKSEYLRAAIEQATADVFYVVVNYESAWRPGLEKELLSREWDVVICDESHRIKSASGRASKFAWLVGRNARRRLALSGTVLPHSPLDAFAQFRFLDSGIFGTSWTAFRSRYARMHPQFPSKVIEYLNQDELSSKIAQLAFRVKASDVLKLPPALHASLPVQLSKDSRKAYGDLEEELIADVQGQTVTVANAMVKMVRLAQITSGYVPIDTAGDEVQRFALLGSEKQDCLEDFLEDIPTAEPVVVFANFKHDLKNIRAVSEKLGRRYGEISGDEHSALTPHATMREDVDLVGVQWQSGGVGIDLTRACYCVFYSHTFNLGNYDQALARLHRPGQTRPVRYYRIEAVGTIDKQIYAALDARREVVEYVLEQIGAENVTV